VAASTFYRRQQDLVDNGLVGSTGPDRHKLFTITQLGKETLAA
jgi:predicted transcriptional regulator